MASTHQVLTTTPVDLVSELSLDADETYGAQFLGLGMAFVTEAAS